MTNNDMKILSLKGSLSLKLTSGDPTYTEELAEVVALLPESQIYRNEIQGLIRIMSKKLETAQLEPLLDVVRQTGCGSEGFILLERQLIGLVGRTSTEQIAGLRLLLANELPPDADRFDNCGFYSECLNMAMVTGDMTLVADVAAIIDGFVKKGE